MTVPRAEPPFAADEATMLRSFLDFYRATILRQADGLDAAQLATPLPPAEMTLGGMLKHLAFVESHWFEVVLGGAPYAAPFDAVDWDADSDWDWHSARDDSPDELRALLRAAIGRADAATDAALAAVDGLDTASVRRSRRTDEAFTLRWILVHMIEEYARHAGHADLIRESIDGETDL
jgi:uncharacterized damage-inducible protein DinB